MPAQIKMLAARLSLPDDEAVVAIARGQEHAVGAELGSGDPFRVLAHLGRERAVGRVVDANNLARTSDDDLAMVGAHVAHQTNSVFLPDFKNPPPFFPIPRDRDA